jgi:hypothetical protein
MNLLHPDNVTFSRSPEGELRLALPDGTEYAPVVCRRLFPLTDPDQYISIQKPGEREQSEVGIIRALKELPGEQRRIVVDDLQHQHFLPEIVAVDDIRTLHGMDEWRVETDRGPVSFFVSGRKENMAATASNMLLVTDIEKCRYRITDYAALPPRERLLVERVLP